MRSFLVILFAITALVSAHAQTNDNWLEDGIDIPEVEFFGERPMKDIGTQKTDFEERVLKESISLSMADVLTFNSSIFVKNYVVQHSLRSHSEALRLRIHKLRGMDSESIALCWV